MSKSLASVFVGNPRELQFQHFDTPTPRGGEMLVRVLGCTICGSDLHSYEGRRTVPVPTVLGHEIVGEIVAKGASAPAVDLSGQPLQRGDRVTWAIVAHCGDCFYCRRGLPQKCRQGVKYGHESLSPGHELRGGLAEHCLLATGTAVVRLPDDLPLSVSCPASCATATVAAATEAAGELADRTVCILGGGLLGLTAAAMCHAAGATVITVDPQAGRRQRALRFGTRHAVAPDDIASLVETLTNGFGVDAVLELSGASTAWDTAWPLVRTGGRIILVGAVFPGPPVSFVPEQVIRRHLSIHGIHNYAPRHLVAAVRFLEQHHARYPFAELVAGWLPLSQAAEGFERAADPQVIRIGIGANDAAR